MSRPSDWSAVGMGVDPTPGDPWAVRDIASSWGGTGGRIRGLAAEARRIEAGVPVSSWEGSSGDAFRAVVGELPVLFERWAVGVEAGRTALSGWAQDLEACQTVAGRALVQAIQAREELAAGQLAVTDATAGLHSAQAAVTALTGPGTAPAEAWQLRPADDRVQDAHLRASDAQSRIGSAQERLRAAIRLAQGAEADYQDAAARAMSRLDDATEDIARARAAIPESHLDYLELSTAPAAERLAWLETADPAAIRRMLPEHPGLVQQFWDHPPDPAAVHAWWQLLASGAQQALIGAAPAILGNLGGIPYKTRDTINQGRLAAQRRATEARIDALQKKLDATPQLTTSGNVAVENPEHRKLKDQLDKATAQRAALTDINNALEKVQGGGNRALVDFDFSVWPPLAAVGIGDLDTAQKIGYALPGMANEIGVNDGCITDWAKGAQNVLTRERQDDPASTYAVVAAIPYKSPELNSEVSTNAAVAGAPRVAAELDALAATRIAAGNPAIVTPLGHSYATSVLSVALTQVKHKVHAVVLLGSAGLVNQPTEFHVDHTDGMPNVYATRAADDHLATIGYTTGPGHNINPGDPAHATLNPFNGVLEIRAGGGIPAEGIHIFGSNGATWNGQHYLPTDGHSTIGTNPKDDLLDRAVYVHEHMVGFQASYGHGYLDPHTESLHNAAAALTGHPERIAGGTVDQAHAELPK